MRNVGQADAEFRQPRKVMRVELSRYQSYLPQDMPEFVAAAGVVAALLGGLAPGLRTAEYHFEVWYQQVVKDLLPQSPLTE